MRSSKSRSRGKNRSNNNRPQGNVVNRVFDSSGPEGKVRGTPQQIIEKYQQLHRDAQLANDRVAAENFAQHAEHYARMLGEAMKEQEARRVAQEAQQAQRQNNQNRDQNGQGRDQNRDQDRERGPRGPDQQQAAQDDANMSPAALAAAAGSRADVGSGDQPDVIDLSEGDGDSGLVETVEAAPKPARKPRSRKPKVEGDAPKAEKPAKVKKPETDAPADEKPAAE